MATDRQATPLADLHLADLDPQDKVAPNFRVYELCRSEIADRLAMDNRLPSDDVLRAAVHLAREVMQPIRKGFGRFSPNSVYRSQELERVMKKRPKDWISTSDHTRGCACDLEIPGKSTLALALWAAEHLADYDQIICECVDPRRGPNAGWVHIALRPPGQGENRREHLSYVLDLRTNRWVYVPGLHNSVP
jgi:hypothetical protein